MTASPTINKLLTEIKQLDQIDQLTLLQQIAGFLKKPEASPKKTGLSALSGLGAELWKNTSAIDQYVEEERQW